MFETSAFGKPCTEQCECAATNCANASNEFVRFFILVVFLHFVLYIIQKTFSFEKVFVVEHTGFEPVTSTMRM